MRRKTQSGQIDLAEQIEEQLRPNKIGSLKSWNFLQSERKKLIFKNNGSWNNFAPDEPVVFFVKKFQVSINND